MKKMARYLPIVLMIMISGAEYSPGRGRFEPPKDSVAPPPPPGRSCEGRAQAWLEGFAQENPDEYERLKTLRQENPEAFREELRSRVRAARQDWSRRRFPPPPPRPPRLPHGRAEALALPELAPLVQDYRNAASDDQREQAKNAMTSKLNELFDEHSTAQRQHLAELEAHLAHLRELLDYRESKREHIVARWFEALLRPETPDVRE